MAHFQAFGGSPLQCFLHQKAPREAARTLADHAPPVTRADEHPVPCPLTATSRPPLVGLAGRVRAGHCVGLVRRRRWGHTEVVTVWSMLEGCVGQLDEPFRR